jgi:hypothetical protein
MNEDQEQAKWSAAEWHGKMLVDRNGEKIGKLQDVYVDVETDEPQFATVKEGFIGRHLTFVPLSGIHVGPNDLQVEVTKEQVRSARPTSKCMVRSCLKKMSPPCITTSSRTTRHPTLRAVVGSLGAERRSSLAVLSR